MINPYRQHLETYFETLNSFKHSTQRLKTVLLRDAKVYTAEGAIYKSGTSLYITDWSSQTENELIHTGASKLTTKEQYSDEVNGLLSREYGYVFAQSYEALERFMKNCMRVKFPGLTEMKGGENLFDRVKRAAMDSFCEYRQLYPQRISLKVQFQIYGEVRHAFVHTQGVLDVGPFISSRDKLQLLKYMFPTANFSDSKVQLHFDYQSFSSSLKNLAEHGFQLYKLLSKGDNYDWQI